MSLKLLLGEPVVVPAGRGRVFLMDRREKASKATPEPAVAVKRMQPREQGRRADGELLCRAGGHWSPATADFFHVSKNERYGFAQTACKACLKARTRAKRAQWSGAR